MIWSMKRRQAKALTVSMSNFLRRKKEVGERENEMNVKIRRERGVYK